MKTAEIAVVGGDVREPVSHALVADLHLPKPWIFWVDLLCSAAVGWSAFAYAVAAEPFSLAMLLAAVLAALSLYRGVCFTHELAHLRRRAIPG